MVYYQDPDKWDILWLDMAQRISLESKDRSTKVGCVIVSPDRRTFISSGWNGFPRGVDDNVDSRHERPEKHYWVIHAERNAIYNHARNGGPSLMGAVAYLNYFPTPCSNCLGSLQQVGIVEIRGTTQKFPGADKNKHYDLDNVTPDMFIETGIRQIALNYEYKV